MKNNHVFNLNKIRIIKLFVLILFNTLSTNSAYSASITYAYPDLQKCMFPQKNAPCVEDATEKTYPVRNPNTGFMYEGCYDKKWNRKGGTSNEALGNVPGGGKCTDPNYPIRVIVRYFTQCTGTKITAGTFTPDDGGAATSCTVTNPCCTSDSRVVVRPKIYGDNGDVVTLRMTGSKSDSISGGLDPIVLNPEGSGDAAYDSCRAMKEMGYNWDPINRTCQIDPSRQCQRLGFIWEDDRCINKCDGSLCTKKYCSGYVYQPDGYTCVCIGDSTTTDINNAPCIGGAASPLPATCTGFLNLVNGEKGQTVTGNYTESGVAKVISAGNGKTRVNQADCNKTTSMVTLSFSNDLPPMCVKCGNGSAACGYYKGSPSTATCTPPAFTNLSNYYIFTYAQGSDAPPTPVVSAAPTAAVINAATSTPTVAYQDVSVESFAVTYGSGSQNAVTSGVTTATANVCIRNTGTINSSQAATVEITFTGPMSGCTIAGTRSIPVGTAPCFNTDASCVLRSPVGKQCSKVFVEYKSGEDSNNANNTRGTAMQVNPSAGAANITAGEEAQCQ
jgi:hypothetical protein